LYGRDDHHQAEALFKAWARALDASTQFDPREGVGSVSLQMIIDFKMKNKRMGVCKDDERGKMKEIVLIDAGTGNLRSVQKALENVGANVTRTDDPQKVFWRKESCAAWRGCVR
jgi:hypothetical protein